MNSQCMQIILMVKKNTLQINTNISLPNCMSMIGSDVTNVKVY